MRRVSHGHGFLISMLFNMAFRPEWPVLAAILFILRKIFPVIPLWCGFAALGIWIGIALLVTLTLSLANRLGNVKDPVRENKNPYSVKSVPMQKSNAPDKEDDPRMCPCCHKFRFDEVGKYEICSVCGWEDDPLQRRDPDLKGGANTLSLNEARHNYLTGKEM